jgi:iron complex outermembrane receptor protein
VRLSSERSGRFGWTVGMSYREVQLDMLATSQTAPNPAPFTILATTQDVVPKTLTAYGEANYAITPKLKLTAGMRYFREKLHQDTMTTSFGVDSNDVNSGSFHTLNPHVNLSYEATRDSLVYANVAKGFRGGGFNLTSSGGANSQVPPTYRPDNIWSYELGTKQQLLQNRAFLDASIYRSVWSDVQSYSFAPGNPVVIVSNSGHVQGWGADIALSVRPVKGLTLSGTFSWNNLAFDQATGDKLPGDPVDGAVRRTFSASVDYRHALTDGATGFVRVDYQRAGPAQMTLRNFGQIIQRPGRDLLSLRLGADIGKYQVALYANNLSNENAPNIIGPFGVFAENLEQRPRTIGVSASAEF